MRNTIFTAIFALLITVSASANSLCNTLYNLETIYGKELKKSTYFNKWEVKMVMTYIQNEELYDSNGNLMTRFSQVRAEFENGYDELNLVLGQDEKTGQKFVRVWSYPGDNEYGVYMTTSGKIVAEIGDGDLYVDGEYCEFDEE